MNSTYTCKKRLQQTKLLTILKIGKAIQIHRFFAMWDKKTGDYYNLLDAMQKNLPCSWIQHAIICPIASQNAE